MVDEALISIAGHAASELALALRMSFMNKEQMDVVRAAGNVFFSSTVTIKFQKTNKKVVFFAQWLTQGGTFFVLVVY
jgi:hypothetical protein